jgi:hypothetical protein
MSRVHQHVFQLWSRHIQKLNSQQNQIALWKTFFGQIIPRQMRWDILIAVTKTFQVILTHKFPTSSFILEQHPDWISPFSPAKDLRQENYNFRKPAKSTQFLKHTQSASPPICCILIFLRQKPLCATPSGYTFRQRSWADGYRNPIRSNTKQDILPRFVYIHICMSLVSRSRALGENRVHLVVF